MKNEKNSLGVIPFCLYFSRMGFRKLDLCAFGLVLQFVNVAMAGGIPPYVGPLEHRICRVGSTCQVQNNNCTVWSLGTWGEVPDGTGCMGGNVGCVSPQDPMPWLDEDKLLQKGEAMAGEPVYFNRSWLSAGQTNNDLDPNCSNGGPAYKYGYEIFNLASIAKTSGGGTIYKATRRRDVFCPPYTTWSTSSGACVREGTTDPFKNQNQCPVASTDATKNGSNPVNTFTGSKLHVETDYRGVGTSSLEFTRYFSDGSVDATNSPIDVFDTPFSNMGPSWGHTYARGVTYFNNGTLIAATVYRPNGARYHFNRVEINGTFVWQSLDADVTDILAETTDTTGAPVWRYLSSNGEIEIYDFASGRLMSIQSREGQLQTLAYNAPGGKLSHVFDGFGRSLEFEYHSTGSFQGLISSVTARSTAHPGVSERFEYQYNDSDRGNDFHAQLENVIYPDETPGDTTDNPRKQ